MTRATPWEHAGVICCPVYIYKPNKRITHTHTHTHIYMYTWMLQQNQQLAYTCTAVGTVTQAVGTVTINNERNTYWAVKVPLITKQWTMNWISLFEGCGSIAKYMYMKSNITLYNQHVQCIIMLKSPHSYELHVHVSLLGNLLY